MLRNWDLYTLLVELQEFAVILENSLVVPQKVKHSYPVIHSFSFRYTVKRNANICSDKNSYMNIHLYLSGASQLALMVKNPPANAGDIKRHRFNPWVGEIPWRRKWQPTALFLPGESLGQRTWQTTVPGVTKSQTQLENSPVVPQKIKHIYPMIHSFSFRYKLKRNANVCSYKNSCMNVHSSAIYNI